MRRVGWLVSGLVCVLAGRGLAATRAFAETYETRTGAEGDAQLETWVDDNDAFGAWDIWRVWWGGTASITDSIELSVYAIAAQQRDGSAAASGSPSSPLELEMLYFMGRWRFVGDGLHGFSAMAELDFCLPTLPAASDQAALPYLDHNSVLGEKLIASYDTDHLVASANLVLAEGLALAPSAAGYGFGWAAKYAAGVAWAPLEPGARGPPLTLGIEAFGDVTPLTRGGTWAIFWPGGFPVAVGPALSFASGRFWATASWGYAPTGAFSGVVPGGGASWTAAEGVGRLIVAFEL